MNFVKENWNNNDIEEFNKYLKSIKREDKIEFAKKTIYVTYFIQYDSICIDF